MAVLTATDTLIPMEWWLTPIISVTMHKISLDETRAGSDRLSKENMVGNEMAE
jgi:hypothetical protein